MLVGPSLAETKRQGTQLTKAAAKRRDLDHVEYQPTSVAQAAQLPQVVPQDVARPFASLGLPQVVPQVQAQALAPPCVASSAARGTTRGCAAAAD